MGNSLSLGLNLRRLRDNAAIRNLVREIRLSEKQFIQPLFAVEGIREREPVPGLTGVFRDTQDSLLRQIESDLESGVRSFLLFGVPGKKTADGKSVDHSFTAGQIAAVKSRFGKDLFLSVDVCLCSSTEHGHCGVLSAEGDHVLNSETVDALAHQSALYAEAGADCVAPSDMMDGRIRAIREKLSEKSLERTLIMSYAAKFHSGFYGPFRVAADSSPKGKSQLQDRASYQIDPARPSDALLSARRDSEEGADILMVKPGLPYLDILSRLSHEIRKPWAVYEVSGEYAAIEKLAEAGLIDAERGHFESWTAFARAGANIIISYGARHARKLLEKFE